MYDINMFIFLQQKIDNREECPDCRKYMIKIYKNKESVVENTDYDIDNNNFYYTEWIENKDNSRNGDLKTIQPININQEYNLSNFENECEFYFSKIFDIKTHKIPESFLLKTIVNKNKYCPNNIKYYITFLEDNLDNEIVNFYKKNNKYETYYKKVKITYNEKDIMEININELSMINKYFIEKKIII